MNNGSDVIIGTNCYLIDARGNIISNVEYPSKDDELKRNLVNFKRFFAHSSAFFHTSIFQKLDGYRIHFERCQDYDLWLRSLSLGFQFICLQEPLVSIRSTKSNFIN